MPAPTPSYIRRAELVEVHDGDTQVYRLDHGRFPKVRSCDEVPIRVHNLYCAELSEPGGIEARDAAIDMIVMAVKLGRPLVVETFRSKTGVTSLGSMERTVGDVWLGDELFADLMVAAGHGSHTR
jgi:endonuclease YncB( thermonuclease family)